MIKIDVSQITKYSKYLITPSTFFIEGGIITCSWIDNNGIPVLHVTGSNLNGEELTDDYYVFT